MFIDRRNFSRQLTAADSLKFRQLTAEGYLDKLFVFLGETKRVNNNTLIYVHNIYIFIHMIVNTLPVKYIIHNPLDLSSFCLYIVIFFLLNS